MLSVFVFSYNHQPYIEQCIDSIFAQRTNFEYEVLLADDCSADDTRKTVMEKYGNKVRILDRPQNLGLCRNMYEAFREAKGKYIFECSGDDYLLTDHVFQTHIDFLENNPEYYSAFNYIRNVNLQTGVEKTIEFPPEFTLLDFLQGKRANLYTGTMRNSFKEDDPVYLCQASRNNEEIQMYYYTLLKGKKKIFPEEMYQYCYRTNAGNYCSTHNYLNMLEDYAKGFRAIEAEDQGKHNFRIAKLWYFERNIDRIIESGDRKLMRGIFRVLTFGEMVNFIWIKFLMKLNHRQIPDFLLKESRLIRQ
jgi:glycosyltransferase involved in cell wall biosynthesis